MAKKKTGKSNEAQVTKLTATVESLRARLKRAESAAAGWKAEAKRLEAEATKRAKQVKKLRKARAPKAPSAAPAARVETPAPETPGRVLDDDSPSCCRA